MIGSREQGYPGMPFDEQKLWDSFRLGSRSAFDQIFDLYIGPLQWYGYAMCKDRDLVDDSVQELFVELWNKRSKVSTTTSIKYYLLKSVRRRIIRNIKSQRWYYSLIPLDESALGEFSIPYESTLIEQETEAARRELLQRLTRTLSKRQQEIIYLRYTEMLSIDEISDVMRLSVESVYSLIGKAMASLRKSAGV